MQFVGNVWKFGNDVDTDAIIPARYLNTSDPEDLAKHCMEDADPEFAKKAQDGDVIVAGKNFGCGSSREHAPIAIKAAKVSCIIAPSFARIFYRNAINIGLPIFECDEAARDIGEGDRVEIDASSGRIKNLTSGKTYQAVPFPEFMQELIDQGGLMKYVEKKVKQNG
ncbi:3-isopropylmalate dehydratase small subunit [Metallumcola ferriviriculae]|uniref:3-isopropylmalate dehydratase small subunit n=1 Tax=Metallumcola ferriviriculae TaxID=3039180 RepID=A0AAU0UIT9_9FIRM|nr:3-isopropylmalate dehydratase small subunit [Desulfitibacteraceae bacterium MK1]